MLICNTAKLLNSKYILASASCDSGSMYSKLCLLVLDVESMNIMILLNVFTYTASWQLIIIIFPIIIYISIHDISKAYCYHNSFRFSK